MINDQISVKDVKVFLNQNKLLSQNENSLDAMRLIAFISFSNPTIKILNNEITDCIENDDVRLLQSIISKSNKGIDELVYYSKHQYINKN